jgi:hypothetical protein
MTRDEAVTIIKRRLGFRRGTSIDDNIIEALKEFQSKKEKAASLPWFLREENSDTAIVASTAAYALPTGFIREDIDFSPAIVIDADSDEVILEPMSYDEAKGLYTPDAEGVPEVYSVRNTQFHLFPTPDADYTFRWTYYKKADVLDTDIENKWLEHAPYVLIAGAGLRIAKELRDVDATAIFSADEKEWNDWLIRHMTEHDEVNQRYVIGKYA